MFKYFSSIKDIYIRAGLDHHFSKHSNVTVSCFKKSMLSSCQTNFMCDLNKCDSLYLYKYLKHDVYPSEYLMSYKHNFKSVRLKFKLRSGILGLGCDLHRQKQDDGLCKYCRAFECVSFHVHCPAYMAERQRLYNGISIGIHDEIFNFFISDFDLLYVHCFVIVMKFLIHISYCFRGCLGVTSKFLVLM